MDLTKNQKKFLKKRIKSLPLSEISKRLGVSEEEVKNYLKDHWRQEKFEKFISSRGAGKPNSVNKLIGFSFANFIKENWKTILFLFALVFITYANSLGNQFVSDDIATIKDNPQVGQVVLGHGPDAFFPNIRAFVIPITYKLFGLNPFFFRIQNVFLHLGSTTTLFFILSLLFEFPIPIFVTSIFAVHPLLSEAITWISGSPYSGSALFILLALLVYILNENGQKKYLLTTVLFWIALLFSQKAIFFPLLIIVYELCYGNFKKTWKKVLPFLVVGLIWGFYLTSLLGGRIQGLQTSFYQQGRFYNPLTQIPTAIFSYLALIFWPDGLTLYHSEMFFTTGQYIIMSFVTLLLLALIIFTFIKKQYRQYSFWLSFFVISLLPFLTPFKIAWIVAERYVYLGSIGIFVLIGIGIQKIAEITKSKNLSYLILGIILITLSGRTVVRNADWKNQDTLWLAAARTSPSSPQNHNNLGDLYSRRGEYEKAVAEFKRAIELLPNYGDAYHNLANTYLQMGKIDLAIQNYQNALHFNPNIWQSHQNLGVIFINQEKYDLAKQHFTEALRLNPQNASLHASLGVVYLKTGQNQAAKEEFLKALQIDPNNQNVRNLLQKASP